MGHYTQLVEQTLSENREKYADTPAGKLGEEMKKAIQKIFPKSLVYGGYEVSFGSGAIFITFTLGKDDKDFANRIEHNDPARTIFAIQRGFDTEGNITSDKLVLERTHGVGFAVNPAEGSYLAMDRHKVGFRKTTGDSKKIVTAIKKYFEKLKKELQANRENVYGLELIKDKF